MSGYTVKPPTGDSNEQTQFIDYFNLFYSKRGQEQISISQQLGNYGTTFFSASRQSYWNTSRSDQQISFGLNVPFGDNDACSYVLKRTQKIKLSAMNDSQYKVFRNTPIDFSF